jgi:hypothetical protein
MIRDVPLFFLVVFLRGRCEKSALFAGSYVQNRGASLVETW